MPSSSENWNDGLESRRDESRSGLSKEDRKFIRWTFGPLFVLTGALIIVALIEAVSR